MKHTVRGNTDWNRPPWPGKDSSNLHWVILWQEILVRNMELTNHHQMEENGKGQKERGDASQHVLPNSQNPPRWNPSWLSDACVTSKDSQSEWLARGNLETNPITIKPETASHVAEQFSWVPLPSCSPPRCPFPIKSLVLSAHVSPQTVHFWVLDKSPLSGPGRGPPSCNNMTLLFVLILKQHCPNFKEVMPSFYCWNES